MLWCCWLGGRKGIQPVKNLSGEVQAWLSVWSEVQTCMWPSWCQCHSLSLASVKSRLVFTFLVPAHLGSPGKRAVRRVCVCVCVYIHTYTQVANLAMSCLRSWPIVSLVCDQSSMSSTCRPWFGNLTSSVRCLPRHALWSASFITTKLIPVSTQHQLRLICSQSFTKLQYGRPTSEKNVYIRTPFLQLIPITQKHKLQKCECANYANNTQIITAVVTI